MRVSLGSLISIIAASAACAACASCSGAGSGQAAAAAPEPAGELVMASGCPVSAIPGCLTIKHAGQVYDLAGASPAIDLTRQVNLNISGHATGEKTACGIKLSQISVEYLGLTCSAPPAS